MEIRWLLFCSQLYKQYKNKWQPWKWMWMHAFTYMYIYSESSSKKTLLGIGSHLLYSELKAQCQENVTICS